MFAERSAWIAAFATGVLALAAGSARAQLPDPAPLGPLGPAALELGPLLEPPPPPLLPPCAPARRTLCVPPASTAAAGGEALAEATSKRRVRRGLGFPKPRKLLGRRAKRLLAQSDQRLTAALGQPLREPARRARAAAAAKLRRSLATTDTARNGRSSQRRTTRMEIQVDACPDPKGVDDMLGNFPVEGRATYSLAAVSRHRRGYILDTLDLELIFQDRGLVDRNADYFGILPNLDRDSLRISRTRQKYDPSTGDSAPRFSGHAFFDIVGWEPATIRPRADFERFLNNTGGIDVIGPELTAPDPMQRSAYKTVAQQFAAWVARQLLDVVAEAERNWRTPNRCVHLQMEGPARLAPDETTGDVIGRLTPVGGVGTKEGLYGRYMTFKAFFINENGRAETIGNLPLDLDEKWFRYTAPRDPWEDDARPGLDVIAYTKGGIGQAPITFEMTPRELQFKVLQAVYRENIAANADIPGSACNISDVATDVQQANEMNLGEQPIDRLHRLTAEEGDETLRGQIAVGGTGRASGTLHGCDITVEPPWPPCTSPFQGDIGGSVAALVEIPPRSGTAKVTWPVTPLVATPVGAELGCVATGFEGTDQNPMPVQEVPADTFFRPGPQTLEFSHSRSDAGGGRSIYSTINYKLVFRRLTRDEIAALPPEEP